MLMIALGPASLIALMLGVLGLAARRHEPLTGDAYYKEHLEGRFRRRGYVFRHPVEAAKRAVRRLYGRG